MAGKQYEHNYDSKINYLSKSLLIWQMFEMVKITYYNHLCYAGYVMMVLFTFGSMKKCSQKKSIRLRDTIQIFIHFFALCVVNDIKINKIRSNLSKKA